MKRTGLITLIMIGWAVLGGLNQACSGPVEPVEPAEPAESAEPVEPVEQVELKEAYLAGRVALRFTAVEEGAKIELRVRSLQLEPLSIVIRRGTTDFDLYDRSVSMESDGMRLELPPRASKSVTFPHAQTGSQRWVSGSVETSQMPLGGGSEAFWLAELRADGSDPLSRDISSRRQRAADQLAARETKTEEGARELMLALSSPDGMLRMRAAKALGEFGSQGLIALPALVEAQQTKDLFGVECFYLGCDRVLEQLKENAGEAISKLKAAKTED